MIDGGRGSQPPRVTPGPYRAGVVPKTLVVLSLLFVCACSVDPGFAVRGGYMRVDLNGDVALSPTSGGGAYDPIDVQSELGVGKVGSPYVAAELTGIVGRIGVSAFRYEDDGTGTLDGPFGDIPAGTVVETDLRIDNVKGTWTFDLLDVGPVRLSPGVGVDWVRLDTTVRSVTPVSAFEEIDVSAPIPIVVLDGAVDLGVVGIELQAGGMSLNAGDVDGTFLDLEGRVVVAPTEWAELFVGYRYISLEAAGDSEGQRYDADLAMDGITIGGGLRF